MVAEPPARPPVHDPIAALAAQMIDLSENAAAKAPLQSKPPEEERKPQVVDQAAPPPAVAAPAAPPPAAAEPAPDLLRKESSTTSELQRKVKNLRKKLKTIDELEAKRADGATLNADQLSKIAARADVEAEIKRWEAFEDTEQLEKEIKKLGKKARQIEELEAKKAAGDDLIADQLQKIANKSKVIDDLKKLEDLKASLL